MEHPANVSLLTEGVSQVGLGDRVGEVIQLQGVTFTSTSTIVIVVAPAFIPSSVVLLFVIGLLHPQDAPMEFVFIELVDSIFVGACHLPESFYSRAIFGVEGELDV